MPKQVMNKILTLAAVLFFSAAVFAKAFPDISISELKKAISEKTVTVIDVNGSESYQGGHIPTAIDYEKIEGKFAKALPQDKNALVVAYCGGPKCVAYKQAA